MKITLRIERFDPERDASPHMESYEADVEETDRVLDALHQVKWSLDGTLTFRRSCGHGVCGSDAMRINGTNRLACKVLIKDLKSPIVVQPLKGFRVLKDLVIDMEPFFAKYRQVKPYLINNEPPPAAGERLQSPQDRDRYDDTTKCILCAACTTACPSFWSNPDYVGPAAIVAAHRFLFDSRDHGKERLDIVGDADGVWRCRTIFNCVEACPRGIQVTRAIQEVKNLIVKKALKGGG